MQMADKIVYTGMIDAYYDFAAFTLKGNIFINNGFSLVCVVLLTVVVCATALFCYLKSKAFKRWYQTLLLLLFTAMIPFGTNIIFFMSSEVTFHLLMRMQYWEQHNVSRVRSMKDS